MLLYKYGFLLNKMKYFLIKNASENPNTPGKGKAPPKRGCTETGSGDDDLHHVTRLPAARLCGGPQPLGDGVRVLDVGQLVGVSVVLHNGK